MTTQLQAWRGKLAKTPVRHQITRLRREIRGRSVTVTAVERLTPSLLRLHLSSPELADFQSAAPDDHVKLFVPDGAGGIAMRDYTPRSFDRLAKTLVIDFALHEAGPATRWALGARPGDILEIGGPRGSTIVPDDFDWVLLTGDETAVPAIARRLEELRADVPVSAVIAIDGPDHRVSLPERAGLTLVWAERNGGPASEDADRLCAAIDQLTFPFGDGFIWIAAEAAVARALRTHAIGVHRHPRAWIKAAGYWMAGSAGAHTKLED